MVEYWFCGAGINADGQFFCEGRLVAGETEDVAVLSEHAEGLCFLRGSNVGFSCHLVQREIQFLLVGMTRERFIKGGWFVVDGVDIRIDEKVGANDTLIVSVIVKDYTFDHMFTECGFH
uniref:Uncharacterized protein n=1 Tax=Romanomermis culicivorax TaxID=13658 RepID=A0A915JJ87_ROMCU